MRLTIGADYTFSPKLYTPPPPKKTSKHINPYA